MARYCNYLVCYDIEDNKKRRNFFRSLKDIGMVPLQKSVFWGELTQAEYQSMQRTAHDTLNPKTDKIFWVVTSLDELKLKQGIGYEHLNIIPPDGYKTI
jgi:CRISPR-associated protein Cas2